MRNFLSSKFQVYDTRYFVYTYNNNSIRIVKHKFCRKSGYEELNKQFSFVDYNSEEVKRASISRTKRNIREIALCNDFEYFATLTINCDLCDRYSLDSVQNNLKKTLKMIKRNNKDFKYIFITEKHKDGAFHFHGLIGGLSSDLFSINSNGYLEISIFSDNLGFNSFSKIKDYTKCCNYITKYITKDCIKNSHNQIYISSRGLKKATREEFSYIDFNPSFSNDYCDILDININDLSRDKLLDLNIQLEKNKIN